MGFKILLLSFSKQGDYAPAIINQSFAQTAKDRISLSTHTINRIPKIDELFMVGGSGYEDLVFKCIRHEGGDVKSRVEGHEFIIFGAYVHRLSAIGDKRLQHQLTAFRT